jgi:hypothetical protein
LHLNFSHFVTAQFCTARAEWCCALGVAERVKAHDIGPEIIVVINTDEKCSAAAAVVLKSCVFILEREALV